MRSPRPRVALRVPLLSGLVMDLLHRRLQRAPTYLAQVAVVVRHELLAVAGNGSSSPQAEPVLVAAGDRSETRGGADGGIGVTLKEAHSSRRDAVRPHQDRRTTTDGSPERRHGRNLIWARKNKPLYLNHPQFEGFEVRQTGRQGTLALEIEREAAKMPEVSRGPKRFGGAPRGEARPLGPPDASRQPHTAAGPQAEGLTNQVVGHGIQFDHFENLAHYPVRR
jgi:hypothetical protein